MSAIPPSKRHYPSDLFAGLASVEELQSAVHEFEGLLFHMDDSTSDTTSTLILDDLVSYERPEIVRFVLSWIDPVWVLRHKSPFSSTDEFKNSSTRELLSQLSIFFQSTPSSVIDRDEERPVDVRPDKRRLYFRELVKDAPEVLAALTTKLSWGDSLPSTNTKMSQKQMKQARRAAAKANAPLNPGPFERLDIPVPETREELEDAIDVVLSTQGAILGEYLNALHGPELEESIKAACIPVETDAVSSEPEGAETDAEPAVPELQNVAVSANSEAIYPTEQLMKFTTLYCDSATGFGDWTINISPRAERDLRDHSRRDRKIFRIILKKIKELSNGHFSPDNQKRLNGHHVDVPIYEAKMTGDLRLVYQIDCIPAAYDTTSERQAIKIFGVYTHAQIGRVSFWDTMGRELGKRGKEYKDRCTFRKRPHHAGDHNCRRVAPRICPPDDLEQMQSLLLKSVHFSQSLLDSLIADRDASFVLQISPTEQEIIEHPHSCYVLGRSGTGKTTTMLYKMLLVEADYEASKEEGRQKRRQLFVTQSRILAEKVEEHFSKLSVGYQLSSTVDHAAKAKMSPFALVDIDDEVNWRNDLPQRFSDLQDQHFPLFVTFDRLCGMLENDMQHDSSSGFYSLPVHDSATDRAKRPVRLTYERFLAAYWPHFPQTLTKGLDPSMVFSEFLGVIMGAEETLASASSFLNRDTYLNLSERAQSTFADQRQRVYDLFESYITQKRLLGDIDAADRTHTILRYLDQRGIPGKKMDYLYIDETQDNLLIDTLLLRSICHNPNGLFWAGDTAQTISVGSSFRFNELKAFIYRIEQRRLETRKASELYYQPVWQPRTFQLTVNYRSHAGIVNCAHTVIEVIQLFWPYSIDILGRERGTVDGLRPVFFTGFDSGNVQYEQFLFGDRKGSYIEFGAHQCELVRDDAARDKLREQVGDIGLIMTLYESKGLEFNDVLLYNFFEDSTVGAAHVCVELKFLYVAITRARNNVWIADTSAKGEPMRILWTSRDQIQNCTPGTDTPRLAISSTSAEWEEQGRRLFANKRYRQSKHCFERALLPQQAAMAGAYYLRAEARKASTATTRQAIQDRNTAFLQAAAAFMDCAKEDGTLSYFRIAAECFEEADKKLQAAENYFNAQEYTRSTELYRKLGKFDEAVDILKNHREKIRPEVVTNVTNVARLFYFKEHKLEKANALFSSYEEELEYLEDRGLDVAHATLLESLGRFYDAGEVHLEEGRTFEAIELFLRDRDSKDSICRGVQCILQSLWRHGSFSVLPKEDDPSVSPLLALADKVDPSLLPENERNELSMFRAICCREISKLQHLGEAFETKNPAAALLCLDPCFINPPKIQALRVDGVAQELRIFFGYVKLLNAFTWIDPCNQPLAEKLFGYIRQGENDYLIPTGTFLYSALHKLNRSTVGENIVLDGSELRERMKRAKELARFLLVSHILCSMAIAIVSTVPHEHLPAPTREEYNLRVRIHLQQILILHTGQFVVNDNVARRYWISRLYSSLHPSFYRLGSASSLDLGSIPEAEAGFQVVRSWIRSWVYDFEFFPAATFLSNLAQVARLSFQFDRKDAMSYLTNSPFMRMQPSIYKRPGDNYVVGEFLWMLEGKQEISIAAGILFVRHIVQNTLPIHISILCDVLEHLCACIIIADRQQRGVVHDVTLPLSWLVNWTSVSGEGPRRTDAFGLLEASLGVLLGRLYSSDEAEHLLFENKNLATLGWRIRETFFARICRCLCLLAYNASYAAGLRVKVLRTITTLRRADLNPWYLPLSDRYVKATSWSDLVQALRWSTAASPLDEMVVLLHAERPRHHPIRNVRQIIYKSHEDIPQLLGTSRSMMESVPAQDVDAQISEVLMLPEDDDIPLEDDSGFAEAAESEKVFSATEPVAMPPALEAIQTTDEEIRAASVIQQAFKRAQRRAERRKAEMAKPNLSASCSNLFVICLKEAEGIDWPNKTYKLQYLGPLPHLLLCLDVVLTTAQKQKKQIKKDLREATHEKLEALDKQLTQLTDVLKQTIQVQKTLGPTAAMHRSANLASLRTHVSTAVQLMRNLPFKTPEGLTQHLERAYKGIVQPKVFVQASTRRKPELNVDDVGMLPSFPSSSEYQ
ncbi:UvrD-like helicase ATP-binding domain-containing protein [Mycena sanguinolenta]|uniref:UvrD-like helicase ATP-binding domain-containing protein n=1 Tax=Mycena sanguinolenta TaxID=230812 RepID=A0A8H6YW37_9AGAR|nr:UvrD-like helicase ATP-binding domain-containing protein [Mycena sanguinolenta]